MTAKKYLLFLILGMVSIFGVHFLMLHFGVVSYGFRVFVVLDLIVFMLFLFGSAIVLTGKPDSQAFVLRFMTLTTIQLVSILSIIAAVIFSGTYAPRHVTFNIIGVFISLLTLQSVLLVYLKNTMDHTS